MHHAILLALAVGIGSALVAFLVSHRVRPQVATRAITTLALVTSLAALWVLAIVAGTNAAQFSGLAREFSWVSDLATSRQYVPSPGGVLAVVALLAILLSSLRVRRKYRRLRILAGPSDLAVIDCDEPLAYTLPGRPGQVVVSTGMLNALTPPERRVLLAHERAHLRHGHYRYVQIAEFAAATVPFLSPLVRRVRFAIERWADEEAAREVGDRALVARAIARAAFAQTSEFGALAFTELEVAERVALLLEEPRRGMPLLEVAFTGAQGSAIGGLAYSLLHMYPGWGV